MHARVIIALAVAVAAAGCVEGGPATECELPEPRCSEIVAEALEWASMSRPGPGIVRIRVLANGGYEIHYVDGTSEAVVP